MTEYREADHEDPDVQGNATGADVDQPHTDQDQSDDDLDRQAATLKERGAVARPQAENPAAVEPGNAPNQ